MSKERHEPKFKGVWFPKEIWWHEGLTLFEKGVWATIDSLGESGDPCRASNAWLAERFESTPQTITNTICKLKKMGLVEDVSVGNQRLLLAKVPHIEGVNPQVYPPKPTGLPDQTTGFTPTPQPNKIENTGENKERLGKAMDELKKRINSLFKREPDDRWSYLEENYLYEVSRRPKVLREMAEIEALYANRGGHFVSDSTAKLLENWTSMLDKARNPKPTRNYEPPNRNAGTFNDGNGEKYRPLL